MSKPFSTAMLRNANFQIAFEEMQRDAAEINRKNGFTAPDLALAAACEPTLDDPCSTRLGALPSAFANARAGLKLMLVVSELGEALEAIRKNLGADEHIPAFSAEEAEIADAVIRLMNYATDRQLRLAEAIIAKNEYNRTRADHTAEARAGEHGKKF